MGSTYVVGSGGGGGKGGGGSTRTPQEAPNTLRSKSYVKIVEVLAEGEIEGLVNGLQSIYLDDTPLQNEDGTFNFSDVVVEERTGSLVQTVSKIGSQVASTDSVGTEIKKATPIEYTINSPEADRTRVAIRVPALTSQNTSNGDLNGTSVSLKIEYKPSGGSWIQPTVGYTVQDINPNNFTGVTSISGNAAVVLSYTVEQVCGTERCRMVRRYTPTTITIQYSKDAGPWTTFYTGNVQQITRGNGSVPFNLQTDSNSNYSIRALVSSGDVSFSFLKGNVPSGEITISGKTTSPYERDFEFDLTGNSPWIVRVTRITDDSLTTSVQNKTYLSSVTTIFNEKFVYPGTAYVALSIDAEQFSSIPSRAYDVKLLKIKVPSNYNPDTRVYTGIWDGTFQVAWTDNPAWCFYDLLTNERYGLGERIDAGQIDKWELYSIAQYCDELVDDGTGSLEPRFTCNVLLQTREEAYKVISDLASLFASITYWGATTDGFSGVIPVQDKPVETASYIFNNSNVQDGVFSYKTANQSTQFNTAYVTYNDPTNAYKQATVYVPDNARIASDGFVRESNITAFGCTSKGQAVRLGRRMLFSNYYENEVVSFVVGADGAVPVIGSVIQVSDSLRAGERRGGRIVEYIDSTHLKLDAQFSFTAGVVYNISVIGFDGNVHESTIVNTGTTTNTVTLVTPLTSVTSKNSAFILSDSGLNVALFKVASVSEVEQHVYQISAIKYEPTKYGYVDDLLPIEPADTTNIVLNEPVTNINTEEVLYQDGVVVRSKLVISWTPARFSSSYMIGYNSNNNNITLSSVTTPSFEILDTTKSTYTISIVSVDILGNKSVPATVIVDVLGKLSPPADITNLNVSAFSNSANITWDLSPDLDVQFGGFIELRHTPKTVGYQWEDGVPIATVAGSSTSAIAPLLSGTYMAKPIDSSGIFSLNAAFADSSFAQIQQLNFVVADQQQTAWVGEKVNLALSGNSLVMLSILNIDDVMVNIDTIQNIDTLDEGEVYSTATYFFDQPVDLGSVVTSRVNSEIEYFAYDTTDTIDSRLDLIDNWQTFDGSVINTSFVTLYIATTVDDPNNIGAVWTDWKKFTVSDYRARGFKFKIEFTNPVPTNNIRLVRAEVSIDMADRVEGGDDINAPDTGYSVVYSAPFYVKPSVAVRIDNMQQGDYYEFTANTASGFTVLFRNSVGTAVSRQFDFISKGYGYVHI